MSEFNEAKEARLWALGRALRRLGEAPADPEAQAARTAGYYRAADEILEGVIALPARTLTGLRVKAEAVAWCHGGRVDFGPAAAVADRLVASIVDDLMAA